MFFLLSVSTVDSHIYCSCCLRTARSEKRRLWVLIVLSRAKLITVLKTSTLSYGNERLSITGQAKKSPLDQSTVNFEQLTMSVRSLNGQNLSAR